MDATRLMSYCERRKFRCLYSHINKANSFAGGKHDHLVINDNIKPFESHFSRGLRRNLFELVKALEFKLLHKQMATPAYPFTAMVLFRASVSVSIAGRVQSHE